MEQTHPSTARWQAKCGDDMTRPRPCFHLWGTPILANVHIFRPNDNRYSEYVESALHVHPDPVMCSMLFAPTNLYSVGPTLVVKKKKNILHHTQVHNGTHKKNC